MVYNYQKVEVGPTKIVVYNFYTAKERPRN